MNNQNLYITQNQNDYNLVSSKKETARLLDFFIDKNFKDSENKKNDFLSNLQIYNEAYNHLYNTAIAEYILKIDDDTIINTIQDNLDSFENFIPVAREKNEISNDFSKYWNKFKDHTELSILQRKHYKISKEEIVKIASDTAKEENKDITGQLIGLLAIFTALSFVIFGSISAFDSITKVLETLDISKIVLIGSLWATGMVLLLYIFLVFILLVTKPNNDKTNPIPKSINTIFAITIAICIALTIVFAILF